MSTIKVDTVRPVTTDASLTLQGDSSGSGVTGITIDSSGNVTLNGTANDLGTVTAGTLGSGVTFPAGHVIQTITDQYASASAVVVTTTSDDYLGSNLECAITPKANGNKLFIQAFINGLYNSANATYSLHSGFAYDADFSSGNGTTIGPREVIADNQNYLNSNAALLGNLYYSIVVTVGTQAPSAGSESIIRPIFKSNGGNFEIMANAGNSLGVCSMIVMEIQS